MKPTLDPIIAAQIRERLQISDMEIENFRIIRNEIRVALNSLLKVLVSFHHVISNTILTCPSRTRCLH